MIFERFFPDCRIKSVYDYDFVALYNKGYRLIIFDIDNTLVEHGMPATQRAVMLFKRLKDIGFKTCLISNNSRQRVQSFYESVKADDFIAKAHKPNKSGYLLCIKNAGEKIETTAFFGDQLFTDIYGAKRLGILSIVVNPIDKREELQIVLKRLLERIVYHYYNKKMGGKT